MEPGGAPSASSYTVQAFQLPSAAVSYLLKRPRANGTIMRAGGNRASWFDWRMAFAWLMAVAVTSAIFFFPITMSPPSPLSALCTGNEVAVVMEGPS